MTSDELVDDAERIVLAAVAELGELRGRVDPHHAGALADREALDSAFARLHAATAEYTAAVVRDDHEDAARGAEALHVLAHDLASTVRRVVRRNGVGPS